MVILGRSWTYEPRVLCRFINLERLHAFESWLSESPAHFIILSSDWSDALSSRLSNFLYQSGHANGKKRKNQKKGEKERKSKHLDYNSNPAV